MATTPAESRLYRTERTLTRTLRVAYPSGRGRVVLRTEKDWDRDLEPVALSEDGYVSTFEVEADQPFLYFKPCLVESGVTHWAVGPNKLLLMTEKDVRVRAQPAAPELPPGGPQRGRLGNAAAPAPAVPVRRGGPGLSRPSRSGTPVSPARGVARAPGAGPAHLPGGGDGRRAP